MAYQLQNLRQVSLSLPIRPGEVLLAMKKRGFGEGKWNGMGGKKLEGETIEEAMVRETFEEIALKPLSYRKVAIIDFLFPEVETEKDWDQQMHIFLVDSWEGEPVESVEMAPRWFNHEAIPYEAMWIDDPHWLPRVLAGETLIGYIAFKGTGEAIKEMALYPTTY